MTAVRGASTKDALPWERVLGGSAPLLQPQILSLPTCHTMTMAQKHEFDEHTATAALQVAKDEEETQDVRRAGCEAVFQSPRIRAPKSA